MTRLTGARGAFVAPSRSSLSPTPSALMTVVESLNDSHWNGWIRVSGSEKTIVTADTVGCENKRLTKGKKMCYDLRKLKRERERYLYEIKQCKKIIIAMCKYRILSERTKHQRKER